VPDIAGFNVQLILDALKKNLLIIHQGALGDFIAIFPAIGRLNERFDRVDVVCQSQLGKLAQYLGLVTRWYPLEGASFASLFSDQPDPHIKARLARYTHVLLFSSSADLEQSVGHIMQQRYHRVEPKPPADQAIHITEYALQNLIRRRLIRRGDLPSDHYFKPANTQKKSNHAGDRKKILLHPGSGQALAAVTIQKS